MSELESRISELERRVARDPASSAFAALAEECRKAGRLEAAVRTCRAGLEHVPGYITAKITLARALSDLGQAAEALQQLQEVLDDAPDNLAAMQTLYEVRRAMGTERGDRPRVLETPSEFSGLASLDEGLPPPIDASFVPTRPTLDTAPAAGPSGPRAPAPVTPEGDPRVVQGLENLLNAIMKSRAAAQGQDRS